MPKKCIELLTAAATYWVASRSRRTDLGKLQATTAMLTAIAEATHVKDRAAARTRDIENVECKIKSFLS